MRVRELFEITEGNDFELNRLTLDRGGVNFVSRTSKNNGVDARVAPLAGRVPFPAGLLTVALSANPLLTFVQIEPFYTGFHVAVLVPNRSMSTNEKLWWAMCLRAHQHRYSYGRQANRTLADLELPDEMPAWAEAEPLPDYGLLRLPVSAGPTPILDTGAWTAFRYPDIFEITQGERVTRAQLRPGPTRFVRASQFRNGIVGTYDLPAAHAAGAITVPYNGSVAHAFYQPAAFFASDDVFVLRAKTPITDRVALFLCAVIRLEQSRFGYGYKWNMERMKKTVIRLPAITANQPDWPFMDAWMASLPFSSITDPAAAATL